MTELTNTKIFDYLARHPNYLGASPQDRLNLAKRLGFRFDPDYEESVKQSGQPFGERKTAILTELYDKIHTQPETPITLEDFLKELPLNTKPRQLLKILIENEGDVPRALRQESPVRYPSQRSPVFPHQKSWARRARTDQEDS